MDKAKILRLCNEINDKIVEFWNCEQIEHDDAQHIISLLDLISFEVNAKPKSNADRIRQMTDEELAEMVSMKVCRIIKPDGNNCPKGFYFGKCDKCVLKWLKQEVIEDAEKD